MSKPSRTYATLEDLMALPDSTRAELIGGEIIEKAAPSADHGFFVMKPGLVRGYTDDILARSAKLAVAIRSGLVRAGLSIANYYATNGLKTRTDFGTFNRSDVPVVMVELGNMKNSTDATRMKLASGRDRYAAGLVAGIRLFLGK